MKKPKLKPVIEETKPKHISRHLKRKQKTHRDLVIEALQSTIKEIKSMEEQDIVTVIVLQYRMKDSRYISDIHSI